MNIKHLNSSFPFETQAFRLFRDLEYEILAGKWTPGQRLIRREISNRFGVSQATVTEALWRLEADGLAESVPMFGTRVTGITVQRVKDEVVLREALECQVARLVAETVPPSDLTPLNQLAEQVDAMMRNADTYSKEGMETHQEFHLALARLTRSSLLIREVERIWRRHCIFFNWVSAKVLPVPEHWHRTLLGALSTGDPQKAEDVMRQHVNYGSTHQLEVLRKMSEDTLSIKS
jgi:DNA-binding GntR family transcriptional regulator